MKTNQEEVLLRISFNLVTYLCYCYPQAIQAMIDKITKNVDEVVSSKQRSIELLIANYKKSPKGL